MEKQLRLLLAAEYFYPAKLGGPANTLYWLAKGFVRNNISVTVITTNHTVDKNNNFFDRWHEVDGVKVRYCSSKYRFSYKYILHSIRELKHCDVVMLSSVCFISNLFVAIASFANGKKIIWSPRGELFDSAISGKKYKIRYFHMMDVLFQNRIFFHATSSEEKERIKCYFPKANNIVIIPNYLELPNVVMREESEKPYFLFMGRIKAIKALDRLVLGVSKSEKFINSNYRLILAGPDQNNYKQELENIIDSSGMKDKVIFTGNVSGDCKYKLYADAYFTCLVSHSENFGNVVIESLSQGTPVIASKGTPWEQLVNKGAGFWIDNSPEEIARCVDKAIKMNKNEYLKMRANSSLLASSYDVYNNMETWIEMVHQAVNKR